MEIFLIGLNHGYQLEGCRTNDWTKFDEYLVFCRRELIDLVAEELSEWAIGRNHHLGAIGSVAKNVSSRLNIAHLFCDPDEVERQRLGVLSDNELGQSLGFGNIMNAEQAAIVEQKKREQWFIRERYWLEQLQRLHFSRCVFILGAQHVDSFAELLVSENFVVHIEHRDWEP